MNRDNAEKLVDALMDACEIHAAMLVIGSQESTNHIDHVAELCDNLRDCVIGELASQETQLVPFYTGINETWDHGFVTCGPKVTDTNADTLDGKVV